MSKNETIFQKIEEVTLKLINQFLLFQYSSFNISVKKGVLPNNFKCIGNSTHA